MKCPKCGFVSFPNLSQCKKCGHQFDSAKRPVPPSPEPSSLLASSDAPARGTLAASRAVAQETPPEGPAALVEPEFDDSRRERDSTDLLEGLSPRLPREQPWREELAERVAGFRHRRAHLSRRFDASTTPEFDFEGAMARRETTETDSGASGAFEEPSTGFDPALEKKGPIGSSAPLLESISLDGESKTDRNTGAGAAEAREWTLRTLQPDGADSERLEIVLDPFPPRLGDAAGASSSSFAGMAPLGRRFLAGVADCVLLTLAGGMFAGVFLAGGGRLRLQGSELGIVAAIGAFFLIFYFGLFSALTFSTPGQRMARLEVHSLDGALPTLEESLWRAFGYLVSTAALMLGFVWALVDSDGLTWHDRMSGTYLTAVKGQ